MNYQSAIQYDQMRADKAKAAHMRNAPKEPIPQFDKESAEQLLVAYSKPDTAQQLTPARQELAGLIQLRNAAESVVTGKKAALSKAAALCARLRLDLDALRKTATASANAQAAALAACFESGDAPLPAAPAPVTTGNIDQLQQQYDVAVAAKDQLQSDLIVAEAELTKLQEQVKQGAFTVMRQDGDVIAAEIETLLELIDQRRTMLSALGTSAYKYSKVINSAGGIDRPQLLSARAQNALHNPQPKQYAPGMDPVTKILPRFHAYHTELMQNASAQFADS